MHEHLIMLNETTNDLEEGLVELCAAAIVKEGPL